MIDDIFLFVSDIVFDDTALLNLSEHNREQYAHPFRMASSADFLFLCLTSIPHILQFIG